MWEPRSGGPRVHRRTPDGRRAAHRKTSAGLRIFYRRIGSDTRRSAFFVLYFINRTKQNRACHESTPGLLLFRGKNYRFVLAPPLGAALGAAFVPAFVPAAGFFAAAAPSATNLTSSGSPVMSVFGSCTWRVST